MIKLKLSPSKLKTKWKNQVTRLLRPKNRSNLSKKFPVTYFTLCPVQSSPSRIIFHEAGSRRKFLGAYKTQSILGALSNRPPYHFSAGLKCTRCDPDMINVNLPLFYSPPPPSHLLLDPPPTQRFSSGRPPPVYSMPTRQLRSFQIAKWFFNPWSGQVKRGIVGCIVAFTARGVYFLIQVSCFFFS